MKNHKQKASRHNIRSMTLPSTVVMLFMMFAVVVQPFSNLVQAATATLVPGIVIGTYNILGYYHGDGSRFNPSRLKQIVNNINDMKYDVVGLQEYRNQAKGDAKALEHELQKLNSAWKMSYMQDVKGGYDVDQLNFVYNSSTVRLIEDRVIKAISSKNDCGGGTIAVRAGLFETTAGQEFLVLNAHPNSGHGPEKCDNERLNVVKGALSDPAVASYTGPLFFVGDFNANPEGKRANEENVEQFLIGAGYGNARDIPNAVRERGGRIDHIYYKKATVGVPVYYESLGCKPIPSGNPKLYNSSMTCASDHVPIKAVFGDLSGSGFGCGSNSTLSASKLQQYRAWGIDKYDPTIESCCSETISAGTLIGENNAEKAFNFLISTPIKTNGNEPLDAAQAAGAVGNLMRESGGDTYDLKPDHTSPYGIVQWLGTRWSNPKSTTITGLKEYAASKNKDWKDLQTQLEFIIYELENAESAIIKDSAFLSVTIDEAGAQKAAERWDKFYERSGGGGIDKRKANAVNAFRDFSDNTAGTTTPDEEADPNKAANSVEDEGEDDANTLSTSAANTAGCTNATGEYVFPLKATKSDVRKWGNNPGDTEWKSGLYHENVYPGYFAVDIMAPEGTEVLAFTAGEVIHSNFDSYGAYSVQVKDSAGYTYYYQHMDPNKKTLVVAGDTVKAGDTIGYIGNRQAAWGSSPHLHIDKSKNPGKGLRGTCTASRRNCPIADENRFVKIIKELHDSYEKLSDTGNITL